MSGKTQTRFECELKMFNHEYEIYSLTYSPDITDEELELNAAGKLKENDNESVGVTSEVGDSTKDVNGKEVDSLYSNLVNVGSSFVYTVDRNKVDKNQNISNILASIYKHTLTN